MSHKLTTEQIHQKLLSCGRGITLVGEYLGNRNLKHNLQCENGHMWSSNLANVLLGSGCLECTTFSPLNSEKIGHKLLLQENGIVMVGEYLGNNKIKHEFKCKNNHLWKSVVGNVLNGSGCPVCSNKLPLTTEIIQERLYNDNKGIRIVGEYDYREVKHKFTCKENHIWETSITHILHSKSGCPVCIGAIKLTTETIQNRLDLQNRQIILNEQYKGSNNLKHEFKCCICSNIWCTSTITSVLDGKTGCPNCSKSGFKLNKESYFYLYSLNNSDNLEVVGFGITNDFKKRNIAHIRTFRRNNIKYEILKVYHFNNGFISQNIENFLKKLPSIINYKISGFKKESLPLSYKDFIQEVVYLFELNFLYIK